MQMLFAVASVAENVKDAHRGTEFLPQVFQLACALPPHERITHTLLHLLGMR